MIIGTLNVNGLRSAVRKGFTRWVVDSAADVLLLQETKCDQRIAEHLLDELPNHRVVIVRGDDPGKHGVGLLVKRELEFELLVGPFPSHLNEGERAGRSVGARIGNLVLLNVYVPSGSRNADRRRVKLHWLQACVESALELHSADPQLEVVLGGDFNVARSLLDVEGEPPRAKKPGFLPAEQNEIDRLEQAGWVDAVRQAWGPSPGPFTWHSRTRGWRLDHLWLSPRSRLSVSSVECPAEPRLSDHRPLLACFG